MTHLKVLFKALSQRIGDLVEADKLAHAQHLCMVACSARVQSLDDRRDIAEYTSIHKCCETKYGHIL
jgi:hypothetical protein